MSPEVLANDLRTLQGLRDALYLLKRYTHDEMEVTGHSFTVALALCNIAQAVQELEEETAALEESLITETAVMFHLGMEVTDGSAKGQSTG